MTQAIAAMILDTIRAYPYQFMALMLIMPIAGLVSLECKRDIASTVYALVTAILTGGLVALDIVTRHV